MVRARVPPHSAQEFSLAFAALPREGRPPCLPEVRDSESEAAQRKGAQAGGAAEEARGKLLSRALECGGLVLNKGRPLTLHGLDII